MLLFVIVAVIVVVLAALLLLLLLMMLFLLLFVVLVLAGAGAVAVGKRYDTSLQIRVGLHCGPVIAGIMGKERLCFDLWGPTVEAANEMEASGVPSKVHLSHAV